MNNSTIIKSILFDLDGTLLDTAPDFLRIINIILTEQQRPTLRLSNLRPYISGGTTAMIKFAFDIDKDHPHFLNLREQFLSLYAQNIVELTRPFPGALEMLAQLTQRNIPWGIVTNKYQCYTDLLLNTHQLLPQTACIVCGDTLEQAKPHPEPLLHAARLLNCAPEHCVYVGDSQNDILAGQRAGMQTVIANYGYIAEDENTTAWQADGSINEPLDIMRWL